MFTKINMTTTASATAVGLGSITKTTHLFDEVSVFFNKD
jgi:hypothetical protein